MKSLFVAALAAIFLAPAPARAVDVNGRFHSKTPGGLPDGWVMHEWSGYKPFPTVTTIPEAHQGHTVLRIADILGDGGGAIQTRAKFPARAGAVGRIAFLAKGTGLAWATFYRWGPKGEWNGVITSSPLALSGVWQPHVVTVPIDNGPNAETHAVSLALGGKMGAEIQICDLSLTLQPATILGDARLPKSWTVFAPVDADLKPTAQQLRSIPQTLGGAQGRPAMLLSGTIDLGPLPAAGGPRSAWVFGAMAAPYACDVTLGAGAEGAMQYYLNGELVFDASASSGHAAPAEIDNHVQQVRLQPGTNVIAVRVVPRTGGSVVKLAGPLDLRGIVRRLRFDQRAFEERFDAAPVRCSGNPRLVQGTPTPGLLSLTGQGVFATDTELAISCPHSAVPLPDAADDNLFAAAGVRIQDFGPHPASPQAALEISASELTCRIRSQPDADLLELSVLDNGRLLQACEIPGKSLPADFTFGVNAAGKWIVSVESLVDSRTTTLGGKRSSPPVSPVAFAYRLRAGKAAAQVTLDNLVIGRAAQEAKTGSTPFKVELLPHFDPVKAGWKKVFDEQFEGDKLDLDKWYFSPTSEKDYAKVHDGMLEIVCNWATPDKTKTKSASLYSHQVFGHGFFEARVKFRQQPGWWSAFWLCTHGPSNPFLDGWEIDIYEDYYMGPKKPGEAPRGILDHNLHVFACGTLRSWNYGSKLPGKPDDWYVVGCRWTPFEVSYYLDGKLIASEANHSPYTSVTFDPFHHAAGFVPLHAILSGCCGKSGGDPTQGKFPESFFVDYVRIYQYPHDSDPTVRLTKKPDEAVYLLKPGDALHLEADVAPSPKTGAKIKQVYLFDSGALLDYRSAPPYRFDVTISQEYYNGTNFVKPGRTGIRPDWDRGLHAFCVLAQDELGNVGRSETVVKLLRKQGTTRPYLGKPIDLPGEIVLSHYDEGGQGFAYSDSTPGNTASKTFRTGEDVDATGKTIGGVSGGEWLKYSVRVTRPGKYRFTLDYGTPAPRQRGPKLLIDGKVVGDFQTPAHEFPDWRHTSKAQLPPVPLADGEHEIVLLMQGAYNLGSLHATPEGE